MGKEIPTFDRSAKQEGLDAKTGDDPTLASYITSIFYLLSVPSFLGLAYLGHTAGYYSYAGMIPVFAGLLFGSVVVAFALMHVLTGK